MISIALNCIYYITQVLCVIYTLEVLYKEFYILVNSTNILHVDTFYIIIFNYCHIIRNTKHIVIDTPSPRYTYKCNLNDTI